MSWKWEVKAHGGLARLDYTQRHQQDSGSAVLAARGCGCAGIGADPWDELDDPALGPDRWTIRSVATDSPSTETPSARCSQLPRNYQKLT